MRPLWSMTVLLRISFYLESSEERGESSALYLSHPECKLDLRGGRFALSMKKNVVTSREDQSAEMYNELSGIGSKGLKDYLSRIRKGGSCFG